MPCKDYAAYAKTPHGQAARARAHAKYIEARRMRALKKLNPAPLLQVINKWRTS